MSLQFGSITFSDPVKLAQWRPASGRGLYCVCFADREWRPVPYQPIYFGNAENLAEENLLAEQAALDSWAAHVSSPSKLLVAHANLSCFSADDLMLFERQLVAQYQPPGNHWEVPAAIVLPAQRQSNVLTKYDRASHIAMPEQWEKKYA